MKKTGFTLIEVMIASTVFLVVAGIALSFSVAAVNQTDLNTSTAWSLSGIVAVMEPIEKELAQGSVSYLDGEEEGSPGTVIDTNNTCHEINIPSGSGQNVLIFRKMAGYNKTDQRIIWSKPITYQLAANRGETVNGTDDNNNGFVDEMCLQRNYNGETTFLTTSLLFGNAGSIEFFRDGRLITVTFKYFESPGVEKTIRTSVALAEM